MNVSGKTNGIELYRYAATGTTTLKVTAGSSITIGGGDNAIVEMSDTGADFTTVADMELTAPSVTFAGAVNAANSSLTVNTGSENARSARMAFNGDFLVNKLSSGQDGALVATFDEEMGDVQIADSGDVDQIDFTVEGDAASTLSTDEAAQYLKDTDLGRKGNYSKTIHNAAWEVEEVADAEGNTTTTLRGSELTQSSMDIVALSMLAWRNETTTLNDRMATLRGNPANVGAWVRWNGGEYQYDDRGVEHQFNTIEVGVDTLVNPQWTIGASFSYTKGDGDFDHGTTDSDTYAGALYALWTHESGSFVDVVAKAGKLSTDFDFRGVSGVEADSGSFDQNGFIFGVETGHRFALPMNTFVEPQIQLTYSSLGSDSVTTQSRHIDIDTTESLIARVGVMAGITCPNNRGSAYVRVSALHDFQGDVEGSFRARNNPDSITMTEELDDTWMEFGLGADFKVSDNAYVFTDVLKSTGGEIDLDWRANVGAKLFF